MLHHKLTRAGKIVRKNKFALRIARTPDRNGGKPKRFGIKHTHHQCGDYMGVFDVYVIIRAKSIRWNSTNKVCIVLLPKRFAQFDSGNFGKGVSLVGWFKRPCKQGVFLDWLSSQTRVSAETRQI